MTDHQGRIVHSATMGWTYNTADNVPTEGPHIAAIAIIFTIASFVVLSLRLYVRGWMIKTIGPGTCIPGGLRLTIIADFGSLTDDVILGFTWVSNQVDYLLENCL